MEDTAVDEFIEQLSQIMDDPKVVSITLSAEREDGSETVLILDRGEDEDEAECLCEKVAMLESRLMDLEAAVVSLSIRE